MNSLSRRGFLAGGLALAGAGLLAACGAEGSGPSVVLVTPNGPQVDAVDARRYRDGATRAFAHTAATGEVDLGGPTVSTWSYDGVVPGREMRVTAGDQVQLQLTNRLPQATTVHWHGLDIRNDMDGVPDVTQSPIPPGGSFTYRYVVDGPGTYWYHPHVGVQFDHGLYGPLIVEDPHEPLSYDEDWTVVLDDWLDGVDGLTPEVVFAALRGGMSGMDGGATPSSSTPMSGMNMPGMTTPPSTSAMSGMPMGGSPMPSSGSMPGSSAILMHATSPLLGGDAGDVKYPYYLINGRVPTAPVTFSSKPGRRARIRFINAGGDTAFRVALGGHRMTVVHTDGHPIKPVQADTLLIGMGERYDVLVTLADGVFPLVALAEGKNATALALVRTGSGATPPATARPSELNGALVGGSEVSQLTAASSAQLAARTVNDEIPLTLTGRMADYSWGINGKQYNPEVPLAVLTSGQRVRMIYTNTTTMWHPMHLHGQAFAVGGPNGPRKDTVMVLPGASVTCEFDTDNPGLWVTHCHNVYHENAGMMGVLAYRT
ncbi:MAG: multicopper oxidase [Solirubrobacterales bacterium]|jgi:FtsP/CotA-like multicopper oxidase with cupredoxin domain|nr:multicopper oxidase [Solirubrobacterales bacterium]